jgi:hypothetical protein
MKRLEDIPKKEIFNVPEGYFETLPGIIQSKIAEKKKGTEKTFFVYSLRYALPAIILFAIGVYWLKPVNRPTDAESILASVPIKDLITYINNSELTTEDLLDYAQFNEDELKTLEDEVYKLNIEDFEIDNLMDGIESDSLKL